MGDEDESDLKPWYQNSDISHTLQLIHQIERRKKNLAISSWAILVWVSLFIPISLYYMSCRPDAFSSKSSDYILDSFLLKFEEKIVSGAGNGALQSAFNSVLNPIHALIGGEDSKIKDFHTNVLHIGRFGFLIFYTMFLILSALGLEFLKMYRIAKSSRSP